MIPRSQYDGCLFEGKREFKFYFADDNAVYSGKVNEDPKLIKKIPGVMCLAYQGTTLYAGTVEGELILPKSNRLKSKRKGPVLKFLHMDKLCDVSEWGGEYLVTESQHPFEESRKAWVFDTPQIYTWEDSLVLLNDNCLVNLKGDPVREFECTPDDLIEIGNQYVLQKGADILDFNENIITTLPSDADNACYHNGCFIYPRSKGLEILVEVTESRYHIYKDMFVTCVMPKKDF